MAAEVKIVPAKASHIRTIANRMRKADRDEVYAASGRSPAAALYYSYRKSSCCWTALFDGQPELMWGVGDINILTGVGAPWLLGTNAVETNFRVFLRISSTWPAQLLGRYSVLRNFVDVRNTVSVRWLEWLGFRLLDPVEFRGYQFRLFEMVAADV
ncbi:hypothetical protein ACVIRO_001043 [Rhizobium ruizarguesonis]